jgi:hypothetical protein
MDPITFRPQPKGYDHELMFSGDRRIGYRGLKDGSVGLERCPICGKENYVLNVSSGVCTWCRWDVKKAL